jgi:hypothetical protein
MGNDINPFQPEVLRLRVPLKQGEALYTELTFHPPVLRDLLHTDEHKQGSIGYAIAFLSAITRVPEIALCNIVPEDWADICLILAKQHMRFSGEINLLDKKEADAPENPTEAEGNGTHLRASSPTSAE